MPDSKKKVAAPTEAYRVFMSSTYVDMQKYREAIRNALTKADCLSYGMERFGASAVPPLEKCYEELSACQIYVCALGMRYGSIDEQTQKSYTQLEYEKAESLGIPILAFLMDSKTVALVEGEYDTGDSADKLRSFKEKIKNSKTVTCDYFDSPASLEGKVYQAVKNEIERQKKREKGSSGGKDSYVDGAKLFKKFVKRPARYKNQDAILRVRLDGQYGGWRLRDELYKAFGFEPGHALFLNDVYTLGVKPDVADIIWTVDCFADGDAADWLDNNEVEQGAIIEGKFRFGYEKVKKSGRASVNADVEDAFIANLIMLEGISVVSRDVPVNFTSDSIAGLLKSYGINIEEDR